MENISLSIINLRADKEKALAANQIHLNTSPDFNRKYESWDDMMKTRFVESLLLGRATNPIWIVLNDEEDTEEILDGMHRITTALAFLNNVFSITGKYLMSLEKEQYDKKKFNDLDTDNKSRIRNYSFLFNKLDSSYRKDKNKLKDMYELLNRSSMTLNDYEFNKVILNPFYEIISKYKPDFVKSRFFDKDKDSRGNIDAQIIEMVVLSEDLSSSWSSINHLKDQWIKYKIGETAEDVEEFLKKNTIEIEDKMSFMIKIINQFYQKNLFSKNKKTFKKFFLIYKCIISRCCHFIPSIALFNRIADGITEEIQKELLIDNIQNKLGCNSRNATFQKKILEKIDGIIQAPLQEEGISRKFPKKMIQEKLIYQNSICPSCNLQIEENAIYEGDHIIPWTAGGKTIPENLQVLHKRCHQLKHA
jgi:hypothetical protein